MGYCPWTDGGLADGALGRQFWATNQQAEGSAGLHVTCVNTAQGRVHEPGTTPPPPPSQQQPSIHSLTSPALCSGGYGNV